MAIWHVGLAAYANRKGGWLALSAAIGWPLICQHFTLICYIKVY